MYPNNEQYDGDYVEGVLLVCDGRSETVRVDTPTLTVISTKVTSARTRSTE